MAGLMAVGAGSALSLPTFSWGANLTGTTADGFDYAIGAKSDSAGNVYVVSNVYNGAFPTDFVDVEVRKFTANGTLIAGTVTINLHGFDDVAYDMDVDAAGNFYIVGYTALDGTLTDTNIFVRKHNLNGVLLWADEIVPGANNKDEYAYDVFVDPAGNVYVAGETPGGVLR
jgi:hypothetical protein